MKVIRRYTTTILTLIIVTITIDGCGEKSTGELNIVVLDAATQIPVEGVLVYLKDFRHAVRTDRWGTSRIPGNFLPSEIEFTAKNYKRASIQSNAIAQTNVMYLDYDSSLVNPIEAELVFTKADTLRGSYGTYRANNDIKTYVLDIQIDIARKYIMGSNTIEFAMLEDGDRIQIDLFDNLDVDSILYQGRKLDYTREYNAVFIDFPEQLKKGSWHHVEFFYSGNPIETGRFGGLSFKEDSLGNPWIFTACQGIGASLWWPNKDQQPDEPDSMRISVTVPAGVMDVSNGKLEAITELENGLTRYEWIVHYPINNYCVSLNIGNYTHFSEEYRGMMLDYYVLPYHLEQAKRQFQQVVPMLECFEEHFGDYPFPNDGYKLIEVPYSGMEHQSAITYGNLFKNGYLDRDWTGVGISTRFDFIIVHESAHEWFGNSISANDVSDAWIHEGWGTYAEAVYVECQWGYKDALKYMNGYQERDMIANREPIIGPTAVNHWPTGDMYFKGALFLNTIRSIIDDDELWWSFVYDYANHFKHRNIFTDEVINYFNNYLDRDLKPIFEQYLYHAQLPVLQVRQFEDRFEYRWQANVPDFTMPVKAGFKDEELQFLYPTSQWQTQLLAGREMENWQAATDRFYIMVEIESGN
ncbi:MAG: M1 family metallopeptidase [Candidatus Neomarinimicrobiota bacterium]